MDDGHARDTVHSGGVSVTSLPEGVALGYQRAGPTALRLLVGSELRRLREAKGIASRDAADAIHGSSSKMSRIELGRTSLKPQDVADLLTLYGVHDKADRDSLLTMAEQASAHGWWHSYLDVIPAWFEPYLGLEQAARVIRCYEVQFVPGLLQTEDYARAVILLGHAGAPAEEIDRRVGLRMRRQEILERPDPPCVWAVIDETALRRPIGGAATMRRQIAHLIEIAERPRVTIEIAPLSMGGHSAAGGPITMLRFPEDAIRDMVYLEQLTSAYYPDKQAGIEHYWHVMNRLVTEAEPPSATAGFLRRLLNDM